jgi:hypothetical protein
MQRWAHGSPEATQTQALDGSVADQASSFVDAFGPEIIEFKGPSVFYSR